MRVEGTTYFQPLIAPAVRTPIVAPPKAKVCCAALSRSKEPLGCSRHSSCAAGSQAGGVGSLLVSAIVISSLPRASHLHTGSPTVPRHGRKQMPGFRNKLH